MPSPARPKIYHITHVENLRGMVDSVVWSDAERIRQGLACTVVGMSEIKRRRLEELEVGCHSGTRAGEYVPFYFCPRSVMLFLLHRGNNPGLEYQGGQRPVLHLEFDAARTIQWAAQERRRWAFSRGNAGARCSVFSDDVAQLRALDWTAIGKTDWRDPDVKESKQSEFLVETCVAWRLVERIGVFDSGIAREVESALANAVHVPRVEVKRAWYY